jgi:hypothetical protein
VTLLTVDNGRHGQDDLVGVIDDGVDGLIADDGKVLLQVTLALENEIS